MSDSDDTDFLLLIPPDFFVINSSRCMSPQRIFPNLQSGINNFGISSENQFDSLIEFRSMENGLSPYSGKYRNRLLHTSSISGTLSTNNSRNNNDPVSSNMFDSSPREKQIENKINMWRSKMDDFVQNPIDRKMDDLFFEQALRRTSNVSDVSKTSDKIMNVAETSTHNLQNSHEPMKFSLHQVDQLLSEMEKTQAEIKSKLQSNKNEHQEKRKEYMNTTTDSGFGGSNRNLSTKTENCQNIEIYRTATEELKNNERISRITNEEIIDDSNGITKKLNTDINNSLPREPKSMLQLSKIMSKENNVETLQQKLEAEVLKKKHCENVIQQLHLNLLEQEQNLSVAQKIDAKKDENIAQLRQAWLRLVEHWNELEQQRQELALMLEQERAEYRNVLTNSNQKIEQLENHVHEAISLASGYKERSEQLEKALKELQESTSEFEENLKKNEEYLKLVEIEKLKLLDQLHLNNENLTIEKQKCLSLESRIVDLESQISMLKFEKNDLVAKLQEENNMTNTLKSDLIKTKENYEKSCNAEVTATKEMNAIKQETMKMKNNLKEFYQKQLDFILTEKVEEYQKEIQKIQLIMHRELHKREKSAEERLQSEIKRLHDAHKMELSEERRINQKHVNILKAELKENRKKIYDLETRSKEDIASKMELAKQVQSALKNHCVEASGLTSGNDNFLKGSSPLNVNRGFVEDDKGYEIDENFSEKNNTRTQLQRMSVDLKKYISMLLNKEPGNPVDDFTNLELLLARSEIDAAGKKSSETQKHTDNFRKKPPWK